MAKPVVDGLEEDLGAELQFARINIKDDDGRALAQRFRITAVPSFIVVAPDGEVLYRKVGGTPDEKAVRALVE